MRLFLIRFHQNTFQTVGRLLGVHIGSGKILMEGFAVEPPWKGNERNVSCIPEGRYEVVRHDSPKFGDVYLVKDVPGRSNILFHAGNYRKDTKGCILPGHALMDMNKDGQWDVSQSRQTLEQLKQIAGSGFELVVAGQGLKRPQMRRYHKITGVYL